MKELLLDLLKSLGIAIVIVSLLFISIYHTSCRITQEGIKIIQADTDCAKIKNVETQNDGIIIDFSRKVEVQTVFAVVSDESVTSIENFLSSTKKIKVNVISMDSTADQDKLKFVMEEKTQAGIKYELFAVVKDSNGNTLTFTIPFFGMCENLAGAVLSEISESYSKKDGISEYIELFITKDGNLFGLELYTAADNRKYSLPLCEVKKGEYVVVHLRSEYENCISETENDLNASKAKGSVTKSRDIWCEGNSAALSSTADIVLLKNKFNQQIIDCVMYCRKDYALNEDWKSASLIKARDECIKQNIWSKNCVPADAVYSRERKSIGYLSRTDIASLKFKTSASAWRGTAKSRQTPGRPNRF
ncbi:MAG: hypothetical protein MJ169_05285 [Treponema sp.]|nr:hypothetical protein [Treponema sp.]